MFRADSLETLTLYWKALFTLHDGINQPYTWTFFAITCVGIATLTVFITSHKNYDSYNSYKGFYPILNLSKMWHQIIFFTLCGLTVLLGYYGNTAFIYGGF